MTVTQALLSFAVIAALLTILPGLDSALVLRTGITRGPRHAAATGLGIVTGCLAWGVAAAVGASAILAVSEVAYRLLTLAGAVYMAWLGASMLASAIRHRGHSAPDAVRPTRMGRVATAGGLGRSWATGLATNLLNPKIGVFYIATIPNFIPQGISPLLMGLLLAAVHAALSIVWFALLIGLARVGARWLAAPRVSRIVDGVTGVVLIGFGVKLVVQPH